MKPNNLDPSLPSAFSKNVLHLIQLEKLKEEETPYHLKLMNKATQIFGSSSFLWGNILVFSIWIIYNVAEKYGHPFDPYPFEFLTLSVSLEAIVLSIIVLIAQNKLQTDSDERAQLDLHINLLAESETTLILKKLQRIESHLGIKTDKEENDRVQELAEDTHPEKLAEFIHQSFCKDLTKKK